MRRRELRNRRRIIQVNLIVRNTLLFDTGGYLRYSANMQHRLSNKDREAMTADCAICGPVFIKMNYRGYVMCRTKWREDQKKANKNRHSGSTQYEYVQRMYYLKAPDGEYRRNHVARLLIEQERRCAICNQDIDDVAHLDHDHNTNKVRGMLCRGCNHGLGNFKDSIESLQSAIVYLTNNKS